MCNTKTLIDELNEQSEHVVQNTSDIILSDTELISVIDTLEKSKNETDIKYEQIEEEHSNDDNSNAPLEEGEAYYLGDGIITGDTDSNVLDFDHFNNIDTALDDIINNTLKENISNNYDMSDDEVVKFADLIISYKNSKDKSKFIVYNKLPEVFKEKINNMANDSIKDLPLKDKHTVLEYTSRLILDELINDAELDTLSIDMEKAMKELLPAPLEMYSEFNKDYIENEFIKVAEKIKDENPKVADNLLAMRRGYIDSYTHEFMYEVFKKPKVQKHVRRAEVLWSRTNSEYLRLAEVCKFRLHPLDYIYKCLIKLGFTDIQAKRLLTLFVYTYTNEISDYNSEEEYNDIYRNAFANYFEGNIVNLTLSEMIVSDFAKQVKENLEKLVNHIDNIITSKEEELSNKKKKK